MSSVGFRSVVKGVLAAQWVATPFYDLSDFTELDDLNKVGEDALVLIQFIGGPERLATIATQGTHGWQENGIFYLHLLVPTGEPSDRALSLGEQLRSLFRGKRFGSYIIEALDPFSDFMGSAIRINGKWHGWSAPGSYYNVVCDG